jgi:hypothetical protein
LKRYLDSQYLRRIMSLLYFGSAHSLIAGLLSITAFTHFANRVAFVGQMMMKYKLEKDLGIGAEVGYSKSTELAKTNPPLAAMNRKFRDC